MDSKHFINTIKSLSIALIDDFRGFLVEDKVEGEDVIRRAEVPDDMLHIQIAFEEMSKVPGWKYVSGTGQNPITELMEEKKAIYITKIAKNGSKDDFQRTVGYLKEAYNQNIEYKGKTQPAYEVLRNIAISNGYDVDEYSLINKESKSVSVEVYKGKNYIKKSRKFNVTPNRSLSEGDELKIGPGFAGFVSGGKFHNLKSYGRYSSISTSKPTNVSSAKNGKDSLKNENR